MHKTAKDPQTYHGMKYRLFFAGFFLDTILFLFLLYSGMTFSIKHSAHSIVNQVSVGNAFYVACLSIFLYIIHFPLGYFNGFVWEHRHGLSNQTFGQWIKDDLKKFVFGLVLSTILVCVIYWFLGRMGGAWWLMAGTFWLFLSVVLAKLMPNVIVPLFYKYKNIDDESLKHSIHEMFNHCRTTLKDIYAIDFSSKTKKANAFICGLGKSRRVVLSDTLLSEFNKEEIEAVVAHELGHYCHRDIVKMLAVNAVLIFSGLYIIDKVLKGAVNYFGFDGMNDIASLPLFILVFSLLGIIVTPLTNWYSCRMEKSADEFSLKLTDKPGAFISMMENLGQMNLSEFQPNKFIEIFFYDHPPLQQRINFARNFKKDK